MGYPLPLRRGFLVRPRAIALLLGATGMLLSEFEEAFPHWMPQVLFPDHDGRVDRLAFGDRFARCPMCPQPGSVMPERYLQFAKTAL